MLINIDDTTYKLDDKNYFSEGTSKDKADQIESELFSLRLANNKYCLRDSPKLDKS